jgi:hypothetical protein
MTTTNLSYNSRAKLALVLQDCYIKNVGVESVGLVQMLESDH